MEQVQQIQQEDQAPQFTFLSLITRTIAGIAGGILGTVVLLVIYILSVSIISPVLAPVEGVDEISPLFIFVLMGMIFASTLASNLLAPLFISFTQKDKYQRITTSLFQLFIVNVVIFIITIPVYLFSVSVGIEFMSIAAGLQIAFSVLASAMIFEIIANYRYALLGVYSTIFAVLFGVAISIMLSLATGSGTLLLFIALPLLWGGVGFMFGLVGLIYQWIVKTWGTDYLATFQEYSRDYGVTEAEQIAQEEAVAQPEPEDTEGVDFLRNDAPPAEQPPVEQPPAQQSPQEQPPTEESPTEEPPNQGV